MFPGPVLINWSYSLCPGKNKTGEEEEKTNTTQGNIRGPKSAPKRAREMERREKDRQTMRNFLLQTSEVRGKQTADKTSPGRPHRVTTAKTPEIQKFPPYKVSVFHHGKL